MQAVFDTLKDWQTLVAGGAALGAAIITVRVMMRQVRLQKKQMDTDREESERQKLRRLAACRAVMPADLSSIIQYTLDCALISGTALRILRDEEESRELTCPVLPDRVIGNLQQLIEQLDDKEANAIADLLSCYQIQYARLSGELGWYNAPERLGSHRIVTTDNIERTLEQTVRLCLLATSMFKFARREEENIPKPKFSSDDVNNALRILELSNVVSDEYSEHLLSLLADEKAGTSD